MKQRGPQRDIQVSIANQDYEQSKRESIEAGHPQTVNYRIIERRNRIKAGSLQNYRANHFAPCRQ